MPRAKAFDRDEVLQAAIRVFAEHGYEGTSAQMLTEAMGIGRQSIYDTFGDKWQLYLAALQTYSRTSVSEQVAVLRTGATPLESLQAHLQFFVASAVEQPACLGLSATAEFGCDRSEVAEISRDAGRILASKLADCVARGQKSGAFTLDLEPGEAAEFLLAQLSALKLSARAGMSRDALDRMSALALRALR
jgi:TetR/AcrR family transcriptional regulator, transcriptional repressor for nem operon